MTDDYYKPNGRVPSSDEEVEEVLNELIPAGLFGTNPAVGLYQCHRAQGKSVHQAYGEVLLAMMPSLDAKPT